MTKRQKLELEQSEKRQRLNELLAIDELSDEQRGELDTLTKRMQAVEVELRAAIVAEPEPAPQQGDTLTALEARCNVGRYFEAVVNHRAVDGAEAELQQHHRLESNQIPLEMLRVEERAVTPAPTDTGAQQQPIIPPVFARSATAFLGVDMPTVGVGDQVYPILTSRPTVGGPHKDSTAVDETTGSFTAETLSPARLQASFFYRRTDAARFAGMDAALRSALSNGLSEKLDAEVIKGTNGMLHGTNLANHTASAVTTYAKYLSDLVYGRVDGRYADVASDIRLVAGSGTYAHAAGQYRTNNANESALDRLMQVSGGVRVSAHVPAVASNKQNVLIRLGDRRDMVAPIWQGVTLIPDEVTKAGTGEIVITAVMLHAVKILRTSGFYKQETKHA